MTASLKPDCVDYSGNCQVDCVVTCILKMWIMPLLAFDYLTVTVTLSVR